MRNVTARNQPSACGAGTPATSQSNDDTYQSISGTIAMCDAMYAIGCARSQSRRKNSALISPNHAHTSSSPGTSRTFTASAIASCSPMQIAPATARPRSVTSPRGTGRYGRQRASSPASLNSSAMRSRANIRNDDANPAATRYHAGK